MLLLKKVNMKIIRKHYLVNDTRIKSWFAFWPVTITNNGIRETRWLEKVRVEQVYKTVIVQHSGIVYEWRNIRFIEKNK